jgi:hypothetical protein
VPKYFVSLSSRVFLNLPLDRAWSGNRQQSCELRFAAKTSTILECPRYSERKTGCPSDEDKEAEIVSCVSAQVPLRDSKENNACHDPNSKGIQVHHDLMSRLSSASMIEF